MKVSVIIPNYNRAALIGETIENMLSQTLLPHEVIVVDDGSTDNSVEAIKSFGNRVTLLQQPNRGPASARNKGLSVATGEFIQFMDSDDLFSKNKIEVQAKKLAETDSDIVFSPWAKLHLNGKYAVFENHVLQNEMPSSRLHLLHWYLRGWSTVFQTFMIKHSFLKSVGQYKEDLMPAEDIELFVRILLRQPKITFTNECLTIYRLHDFAKISGEGTQLNGRLIDRGNYLRYTCKNLKAANYQSDFYTRLCFKTEVFKLSNELNNIEEASDEIIRFLSSQYSKGLVPLMVLLSFYLRVLVFIRFKLTGSRWRTFYKSDYATESQKKLIEDLGYSFQ
jgi:glycosyltransferase involved in cell wall biosynthesis